MGMIAVVAFTGLCFVVCAGCVSFMQNWNPWAARETRKSESLTASKTSSREKTPLERPNIPDETQPDEPAKSRSSVKVSSKGFDTDRAARDKKNGDSKSSTRAKTEDQSDQDAASSHPKKKARHAESKQSSETDKTKTADPAVESDETDKKSRAFKQHDHVAYVERLKSKADELIKKEQRCTLARLCRHTITDEWTLQLYVRQPKSFSFSLYSWDEIDEKWKQSYESETNPGSQWEHHLRFSSAHKECSDLKRKQR